MVFDAPTQNTLRYEERMDLLKRTIAVGKHMSNFPHNL